MGQIHIYARDIIAVVVLIGCFALLWKGIDSFVAALASAVVTYYFIRRDELHVRKE